MALGDLHEKDILVWDIEHRLRYASLIKELAALGFDFPEGLHRCDVSQLNRPEIMSILREAQALLLEVMTSA